MTQYGPDDLAGSDPALAVLARARDLPGLLDAAHEVFSHALAAIRAAEDDAGSLLPALVMAAAAAADGRDAIAAAPALPAARSAPLPFMGRATPGETADRVARLATAVGARLASAPGGGATDRAACQAAARCAARISELLTPSDER